MLLTSAVRKCLTWLCDTEVGKRLVISCRAQKCHCGQQFTKMWIFKCVYNSVFEKIGSRGIFFYRRLQTSTFKIWRLLEDFPRKVDRSSSVLKWKPLYFPRGLWFFHKMRCFFIILKREASPSPHNAHPQGCPSTDELHILVFERQMKNAFSIKHIANSLIFYFIFFLNLNTMPYYQGTNKQKETRKSTLTAKFPAEKFKWKT